MCKFILHAKTRARVLADCFCRYFKAHIRVRQMMYVDQFEVFRCPNRPSWRSQTSRFSVGFSGGNSEQTVKQLREVFSRKHRAHCLKAVPGYWCKIAKHCKQILSPVIANCSMTPRTLLHMERKQRHWNVSLDK